MIARSVKTLVSSIPSVGSTLGLIADFAFKALGFSQTIAVDQKAHTIGATDTEHYQLAARFQIRVLALLENSSSVIPASISPFFSSFYSAYRDGRVRSLTIRAMPTGPLANRAGDWSLAFSPFFHDLDAGNDAISGKHLPSWVMMKRAAAYAYGPASKPLIIRFRPQLSDGRPSQFLPLDGTYGVVTIMVRLLGRDSKDEIKASEFTCETVVEGVVELRSALVSNDAGSDVGGAFKYTVYPVIDSLANVGGAVYHTKTKTLYELKSDGYLCTPGETGCFVSGQISRTVKYELGALEDTALDSAAHTDSFEEILEPMS